jgi:hypothetical protein
MPLARCIRQPAVRGAQVLEIVSGSAGLTGHAPPLTVKASRRRHAPSRGLRRSSWTVSSLGVWERINIGAFLLWVVVLAVALLRGQVERTQDGLG